VALALAATVLLGAGIGLGFLWAPGAEGDDAFRIFYIHVPVALTAYACFGLGAWKALRLLWTRDARHDLESYTAVHMGTIFGVLTLVTGSIWARISWGQWWISGSTILGDGKVALILDVPELIRRSEAAEAAFIRFSSKAI
jgi:heme exporter protein C